MWKPSPPQGFTKEQGQVIIGRPPIPLFGAPQGVGGGAVIAVDRMAYEPGNDTMGYEPANWADAVFLQRIPLTINSGQVPSTQNDFVLLINGTFPDLIGEPEGELRIGTSNILLDYEIQEFDSGTGKLIAWAKVQSISIGDVFSIYFDNPAATDNQNPFAVWSDYNNVYHLNNVPASNSILDSTATQEPGDPVGTTLVAGKIGNAQDFNQASSNKINFSNYDVPFSFTISMWVKTTSIDRGTLLSVVTPVTELNAVFTEVQANGTVRYVYRSPPSTTGGTTVVSSGVVNDDIFHKLVFVYDDAGDNQELFIDGVSVGSVANTQAPQDPSTNNSVLGVIIPSSSVRPFDGIMDEFETFVGVLSADRILTEFNNQNAPNTFYSTGTVESVPPTIDEMGYEV